MMMKVYLKRRKSGNPKESVLKEIRESEINNLFIDCVDDMFALKHMFRRY